MNIERMKKCFANHKATLTDYGNIKILDFKNPNSSEYRIRFLFEEDYCRLHISGDLGELIATNYNNMTYEKFDDFVRDTGYFEGKINCHSRPLYYYDEDSIKEDLKKIIEEHYCLDDILEVYRHSWDTQSTDDELLEEFFNDVLIDFSNDTGIGSKGWDVISENADNAIAYDSDIGKRSTEILNWYMLAFELAQQDLRKVDKDANKKLHNKD